jgi:EAL domain-containing protein (putative c-di-GMP-specific phosphodiesterase class I)/ActR/RegA family two-component response regulator
LFTLSRYLRTDPLSERSYRVAQPLAVPSGAESAMAENRILIIDDQPAIAELIAHGAASCGYEARIACNSDDFLREIEALNPTHIVLDLKMPGMDGIEILRELAERGSRAAIVLASGLDGKLVEAARRFGIERRLDVAGTLLKPFRRDDVCDILERLKVEATTCTPEALSHALENDELFLLYQPKIDLVSGSVVGFEALVRWDHAKLGTILPDAFLPMAESAGLMPTLTDAVADAALRQLRDWRDVFDGRVAVNLSGRGLSDVNLPDRLAARCAALGLEPRRLDLDFTEAGADEDGAETSDILTRLRLKGFGLALDDFGTGHSSLVQLVRLPFSEIKIDRSFIAECVVSDEARVIVKSTVDLAHSLNLHAVAEGVENAAVLQRVAGLGCDMAMGYHFAEPLAAARVPD